jgi:hypothetical protein
MAKKTISKQAKTSKVEVPIIILTYSAFGDDKNFRFFKERLRIHYV